MPWKQVTIELPYTPDALAALLQEGSRGSMSRYTHLDIVDWARRYADELQHQTPLPDELLRCWQIADDITLQWELHIAGHYSVEEMRRFSHVDILLPRHFFDTWLSLLKAPSAPAV